MLLRRNKIVIECTVKKHVVFLRGQTDGCIDTTMTSAGLSSLRFVGEA